jgi:hypothetical protein
MKGEIHEKTESSKLAKFPCTKLNQNIHLLLIFCNETWSDNMVYIDEKWFDMTREKNTYYLLPKKT